MSEIRDFKDLKIWQKGMDIAEKCYFLRKSFPKEELYGMVQQVRGHLRSLICYIRSPLAPLFKGGKESKSPFLRGI
jgi:hypothetical protein